MPIKQISARSIGASIGWALAAKIGGVVKVSIVVGSWAAYFSVGNCIFPLVGLYTGTAGVFVAAAVKFLISCTLPKASIAKILSFHIPGLFAALYWTRPSVVIRVLIPAACMLLFMIHPTGAMAFPYALYWLIPIVVYFKRSQSMFMHALAATFVAHAIGSVIWLYGVSMPATAWITLIPVVAFERILFASGMVVAHAFVSWAGQYADRTAQRAPKIEYTQPTVESLLGIDTTQG